MSEVQNHTPTSPIPPRKAVRSRPRVSVSSAMPTNRVPTRSHTMNDGLTAAPVGGDEPHEDRRCHEGGDQERPPRRPVLVAEHRPPPPEEVGHQQQDERPDAHRDHDRLNDVARRVTDLVVVDPRCEEPDREDHRIHDEDHDADDRTGLHPRGSHTLFVHDALPRVAAEHTGSQHAAERRNAERRATGTNLCTGQPGLG